MDYWFNFEQSGIQDHCSRMIKKWNKQSWITLNAYNSCLIFNSMATGAFIHHGLFILLAIRQRVIRIFLFNIKARHWEEFKYIGEIRCDSISNSVFCNNGIYFICNKKLNVIYLNVTKSSEIISNQSIYN